MKPRQTCSIRTSAAIMLLACVAVACTLARSSTPESPSPAYMPTAQQTVSTGAASSPVRPSPTAPQLVTLAPLVSPTAKSGMAAFVIVNESATPLCGVYVSPQAQTSGWVNRLSRDKLDFQETIRLDLAPGFYKVHLNDCGNHPVLHREFVALVDAYEFRFTDNDLQAYSCELTNTDGIQLYLRGQTSEALDKYESALACFRRLNYAYGEGEVLNNIAAVYMQRGRYSQATELFSKAETIAQQVHNPAGESAAVNGLAALYDYLHLYDRAAQAYTRAREIRHQLGDPPGEAVILNNLAVIYSQLARYDEALVSLREALEVHRQLNNRAQQTVTLNNIAFVFQRQGHYDKAIETFNQALVMARNEHLRTVEGDILYGIGLTSAFQRRFDMALDMFEQALVIRREVGDKAGEGHVLNSIGGVLKKGLGRYDDARKNYEQAMDALESVRALIGGEEGRAGFIGEYSKLYEDAADLYYQLGQFAEAFQTSERARARAFLDQMGNRRLDYRQGSAPELVEQEQALRRKILDLEKSLDAERAKPKAQQNVASLDKWRDGLENARNEYEALLSRLKLISPEYAALVSVNVLTVPEVQTQLLDKHTTLVEYFVLQDKILVWIVESDGFHALSLSIRQEDLRSQLESLRNQIAKEGFDLATAGRLYDDLFAPLVPYVGNHNLIIVPHDLLHYMPFAALWNARSGRYLLQDYAITFAPSASVLKYVLDKRNANEGRLLVMGNPDGSLPNASNEARSIATLYGTSPLLGSQATESQVYKQAGHADILHFATHGEYDKYNPLFSRIRLAADDQNDGNLEVHEIYGLNLSEANLVVLSACETGLGKETEGDELVGLTRAFLYAGTPAIVTTLWTINSAATGILLESFYRHLKGGTTNAESLRTAQLELMAQPQWRTPYYWAAFVLSGDYRGAGGLE